MTVKSMVNSQSRARLRKDRITQSDTLVDRARFELASAEDIRRVPLHHRPTNKAGTRGHRVVPGHERWLIQIRHKKSETAFA